MTTIVGEILFNKTLFTKKDRSESKYLIDDLLGFEFYQRISDNCKVKIVQEAKETSYRKAGNCINDRNPVSKTTVKNIMHKLKFPDETIKEDKNKKVHILYIKVDENQEKLRLQ